MQRPFKGTGHSAQAVCASQARARMHRPLLCPVQCLSLSAPSRPMRPHKCTCTGPTHVPHAAHVRCACANAL